MKYKISRGKTVLGLSLALSGSLLVLPNLARAEEDPVSVPGGLRTAMTAQNAGMGGQAPISAAANEIYQLAQEDPGTGYAGIVLSTQDAGYTLSWKGELSQAVSRLITAHRGKGIRVTVTASKYTFKELDEQARVIMESGATAGGAPVVSAGPSSDGNSLTIGVNSSGLPARNNLRDEAGTDSLPKSLSGGIPVKVTEEETPANIDYGARYTGSFSGKKVVGGMVIRGKATCSSGFSAFSPATNRYYLITAAHCVNGVGDSITNGVGTPIGKVIDVQQSPDSALIELFPEIGAMDWVFSGYGVGLDPSGRKVLSEGRPFEGELLCTNGALRGETCGAKVTKVDQYVKSETGHLRHVNKVEQVAGRILAGAGDSGGSVFTYGVDGKISARGILSMTIHGYNCKNPLPTGKNTRPGCSEHVWITNIYENTTSHNDVVKSLRVQAFDR
ncbi:hypothetical protein [Streptomyces goshikiensis]|uniref:hypothetical protein n=1 Tax=Streptomyces goshikiensis TaxID=1942 RepID=UPI0036499548